MDDHGEVLASGLRSRAAAKRAVYSTLLSRATLAIPCFLIPAVLTSTWPLYFYCSGHNAISLYVSTLVGMLSFGLGLPATIAISPRVSSIDILDLEPEFAEHTTLDVVYYNKGL